MSKPHPFAFGSAVWPGVGKLSEEAAEVGQVIGKLMATGGAVNHWDGTNLHTRLEEEIADVLAAVEFALIHNGLDLQAVDERRRRKLALFIIQRFIRHMGTSFTTGFLELAFREPLFPRLLAPPAPAPAVQVGWTVDDNGGGHFLRVGWRWGGDIWVPLAQADFGSATGAVNYSEEDNARAAALAVGGRVCKLMAGKPPT